MRIDGRKLNQIRPVTITPGYILYPEGSILIEMGETKVLCNVTIEDSVPSWKREQNIPGGWVTAEYAMLPRATQLRTPREIYRPVSRNQEIRRLIGRSLRAAVDLEQLGSRTCIVDCDVLQADGGTRTAAITGGYVALIIALNKLVKDRVIPSNTFKSKIAAISVGMVNGEAMLDLCYQEDGRADVDINIVMSSEGRYIEIQGTAEGEPFSRGEFNELLDLAYIGIGELFTIQHKILDELD
jgi:ribonuclease PH